MILSIKKKKNRKFLKIIFLDGVPKGFLKADSLKNLNLSEGDNVIDKNIKLKIENEIVKYATERTFIYLSKFERSEKQVYNYLKKLLLHEVHIKSIIKKAKALGYIDDKRFTEMFVNSQIILKKSKMEIKSKLVFSGIDALLSNKIVEKLYKKKEDSILEHSTKKALRLYSDKTNELKKIKCLNYLYRRGFEYEQAKNKLNEVWGNQ